MYKPVTPVRKDDLFESCQNGTWPEVLDLLRRGASLYSTDAEDKNILHYACLGNNYNIAEHLIKEKNFASVKNLGKRSKDGETPIQMACRLGHPELLQLFLTATGKPRTEVETLLHTACRRGQASAVRAILEGQHCHVDAGDRFGDVALHHAVRAGHVDVVRTLLDLKADVNRQNNALFTPLYMAVVWDRPEIMGLLLQRSELLLDAKTITGSAALHAACRRKDVAAVKMLLEHRATVHMEDKSHSTPLHIASSMGDFAIVQLLLKAGVKVNPSNDWNNIPLDLARRARHKHIEKLLLEHDKMAKAKMAKAKIVKAKNIAQIFFNRWIDFHQQLKDITPYL